MEITIVWYIGEGYPTFSFCCIRALRKECSPMDRTGKLPMCDVCKVAFKNPSEHSKILLIVVILAGIIFEHLVIDTVSSIFLSPKAHYLSLGQDCSTWKAILCSFTLTMCNVGLPVRCLQSIILTHMNSFLPPFL